MKPSPRWKEHSKQMENHLEAANLNAADPFSWSTLVATMYVGRGNIVTAELIELRRAGVQAGVTWDDKDAPNLIHQRFHLWQWQKSTNLRIKEIRTILEVGAGYGAMVVVCSRLGFRGKYYIVDLPVMERLQRQHLSWRDIKCRVKWGEIRKPDLLIANYSLSEIPVEERNEFMARIRPKTFLFTFQEVWDDYNNTAWFTEWAQRYFRQGGPLWKSWPAVDKTHRYLVSYREDPK